MPSETPPRVLFVHGLEGSPQGTKARYLAEHFDARAPEMDTGNFEDCVRVQREAIASFEPDVVVGSSFGGAVVLALLMEGSWHGPTLLLAPAAAKIGFETPLPDGTRMIVVHGIRDDVVSIEDSRKLVSLGHPSDVQLVEVEDDHRLYGLVETDLLASFVDRLAND